MTKERIEQYIGKISEFLKYIYIVHIILAFCSYTADSWITGITPLIVILLGGLVLLYRLIYVKKFINYPFLGLYVLMVVLYGISSLINIQYGFVDNLKIMVWMTIQFGTLYLCDIQKSKQQVTKELHNCLRLIILLTTIMNLIGLGMLFANYCSFWTGNDGKTYLVGIAYWGRLFGVHTDPNYGAVQTVVAIAALIFFYLRANKKYIKILCGILIAVNMVHMTFSGSRTGVVSLIAMGVVYAFIYALQKGKKIAKAIVLSLVCATLIVVSNEAIETGYNAMISFIEENRPQGGEGEEGTEIEDELVEIGREEAITGDVSNGRFELWKDALRITTSAPFFGVSFANYVPYCMEHLPDTYMLTNGSVVFVAFHNMFMDLLASQGIVGTILFLAIIVLSLRYLWINRKQIAKEDQHMSCFLFSICVAMICSSLFLSEILYAHNQVTVLFWMLWGYMIYYYFHNLRQGSEE